MITEWLLDAANNLIAFFLGMAPAGEAEDIEAWSVTASNTIGPLLAGGAALSAWMPWAALAICFPVVIGIYILLFLLKAARNLFSHFPVIGGNG